VTRRCQAISRESGRNKTLLTLEIAVEMLSHLVIGWGNYFCLRPVSKAYRVTERHAR